jgi:hypothetical protein
MSDFDVSYFFIGVCIGLFSYWRGLISGTQYNVRKQVYEIIRHLPVNVTVEQQGAEFFAYFSHNNEFVAQAPAYDTLIKTVSAMFPEKMLIVAFAEKEVADDAI